MILELLDHSVQNLHHPVAMIAAFIWATALSWLTPAVAQSSIAKIEVSGTAFHITLSDGSVKQGTELAGAVLVFNIGGKQVRIRVAAVMPDASDKSVLLHDFRIDGTDTPLCSPDPYGKQFGFPLVGRSAADGRFLEASPDVFELVCTSGAQGKCVRFGYHPWERAPDGRPTREYYDACVRMVRADYCGDGHSWTRDGTVIDMWDDQGIQKSDTQNDPAFSFEAGWTPEGAVCVAHTRIPENITLDKLKPLCPQLSTLPTCDEALARTAGALLFNRSR